MSRDAVATGGNCQLRGAHRVRMATTTRVADRSDVIDVDAKPKTIHALAVHPLGLGDHRLCTQLRQYGRQMLEVIDLEINRNVTEIRLAPDFTDVTIDLEVYDLKH